MAMRTVKQSEKRSSDHEILLGMLIITEQLVKNFDAHVFKR